MQSPWPFVNAHSCTSIAMRAHTTRQYMARVRTVARFATFGPACHEITDCRPFQALVVKIETSAGIYITISYSLLLLFLHSPVLRFHVTLLLRILRSLLEILQFGDPTGLKIVYAHTA